MSLQEYARYLRVTLGSTIVKTTDDVKISASFDQLNRVCSFVLAEQPETTPADGAAVLVELVNSTDGVSYDLFGGLVDGGPETESEPWGMNVRAVDQLADLRIVHTGDDLDLTGMTPKEAKMEIFDYCGLTYDPDDIVDIAYEFGALEPVKWLSDGSTTAGQIITEIDRVFGLTTQTIGNNRIISFRYDLMPDDATGLYRTFTKGTSIDFRAHHRSRGSRNDIQTIWSVLGVSHEFNDGACTLTPWAKSVHGTARVGHSRRVPQSDDQSDLIQDEALAEYVVRQHMERTSGIPDSGTGAVITSRNLHPGTKLAIVDHTYGISASPRYYCVTQVEITGLLTDLTLVAGPPGDDGTVTTGVDRVCNDTHTGDDIPGDFEPPDADVPPLDDGTIGDFPFPDDGLDVPEPPNTDDPFLDCTDSGEAVDLLNSPWREGSGIIWRYDSETDETLGVYTLQSSQLTYNITTPPTPKTTDNDYIFAQGETVCVSGTVKFCDFDGTAALASPGSGLSLHIRLFPAESEGVGWSQIHFYPEPGADTFGTDRLFGVVAQTENTGPSFDDRVPPHNCVPAVFGGANNDGGYEGAPVGFETEAAFNVCFQTNTERQRVYFDGDFGSGYMEDLICISGVDTPSVLFQTCDHPSGHILQILLVGDSTISSSECPWVEITSLSLGFGTCEENPEYIDPSGGEED